jgi:tRNA threonylcarbamoyl adenosine modification protein YeaZ
MVSENHKILAFDTSSERESAALLEGGTLRAELRSNTSAGHSALLLEAVDFLLGRAGWKLKDLTLIASGVGPGSFTGIRIGVATGLGLAQSLGIPFAGVSGLDVLAQRAARTTAGGRVGVLVDARRGQFHFAGYESKNGRIRRLRKPALIDAADVKDHLADADWITGDLDEDQAPWKSFPCRARWIPVDLFLAEGVGRLGLERKRTWRSGDFLTAEPLYIRPPDAVKNRLEKRHDER